VDIRVMFVDNFAILVAEHLTLPLILQRLR